MKLRGRRAEQEKPMEGEDAIEGERGCDGEDVSRCERVIGSAVMWKEGRCGNAIITGRSNSQRNEEGHDVGFLQVSCDDPNFVDTAGNILDRTRIHPESYSLAEELARAVVHKHYTDANDTQVNAIECIQNDPKLLESFDVHEYADRLETEKGEYKRVTLFDIKMELLHGFKDPKSPYKEPTQDDEFYMLTGESSSHMVLSVHSEQSEPNNTRGNRLGISGEVVEQNHTLILGWSDNLGSLLNQLAIANESLGGGIVAVMAERDKEEMELNIAKIEFCC